MANHPNRSRGGNVYANPSPDEITSARTAAGLTQAEAAASVFAAARAWQDWERGERSMHPGLWNLFQERIAARADVAGNELRGRIARSLRAWTGLHQDDAARAADLTENTLISIEKGRGSNDASWRKLLDYYATRGLHWRGAEDGPAAIVIENS